MPTRKEILPDGRTHWIVSADDAMVVSLLGDDGDYPELSTEDKEELADELRKVREDEDADAPEGG